MFNFGIVQFLFLQYCSSLVVIRTTCDLIDFIIFEDKKTFLKFIAIHGPTRGQFLIIVIFLLIFWCHFSENLISVDGKLFVCCPA